MPSLVVLQLRVTVAVPYTRRALFAAVAYLPAPVVALELSVVGSHRIDRIGKNLMGIGTGPNCESHPSRVRCCIEIVGFATQRAREAQRGGHKPKEAQCPQPGKHETKREEGEI